MSQRLDWTRCQGLSWKRRRREWQVDDKSWSTHEDGLGEVIITEVYVGWGLLKSGAAGRSGEGNNRGELKRLERMRGQGGMLVGYGSI